MTEDIICTKCRLAVTGITVITTTKHTLCDDGQFRNLEQNWDDSGHTEIKCARCGEYVGIDDTRIGG